MSKIKCKTYIFNKHFETRKELAEFTERINDIVINLNMCSHRLKESTQFKILLNVSTALICLKVEIEYLHEEMEE